MCAQSSLLAILLWLQVTDSSGSLPEVKCRNVNPPALGETATLICEFSSSLDVLQVTWQVDKDQKPQTIATYSKKYGVKIVNSGGNYNLISHKESNISTITISDLKKQDEACYVCIFNAFPHGAYKSEICLTFPNESGKVQNIESSREKQQQFDKIFKDNKSTKNDVTRCKVTCSSGDRNIIDIDVKPEEIIDEEPEELTENDADRKVIYKRKFTCEEPGIRPSCTFHTQKLSRRKRALSDEEDGKTIFANCSVTGKAPKIIWENEGSPVSTMEYELKKDGIVTVTSARGYLQSSLHDQEIKLTCVITSKNNKGEQSRNIPTYLLVVITAITIASVVGSVYLYTQRNKKQSLKSKEPHSKELLSHKDTVNQDNVHHDSIHQTPDTRKCGTHESTPGTSVLKRSIYSDRKKKKSKLARPLFPTEDGSSCEKS
ncbi:OX-2 membrane glyco -like [Pelobates cultripes]|nr:OX-2 membrane glyco -like [Pelobates cultripes]